VPELSPDDREAIADLLGMLAEFYRARPTIGWVSPSVYRRLRKYGSQRFGSSEEAGSALTGLAEKIRSAAVDPAT